MYTNTERFYRNWTTSRLKTFRVVIGESDLQIHAEKNLTRKAEDVLRSVRKTLHRHIALNPVFKRSLTPTSSGASQPLIRKMEEAGREWNTGPMASVAGAIAQVVGSGLVKYSSTVIVENGGDIWAIAPGDLEFLVYPGEQSSFAGGIKFTLNAAGGISVCTSSGRVGPSLSLGRADAVTAVHTSAAMADAAATSLANRIHRASDVAGVVKEVAERKQLKGIIAVCGNTFGLWGDVRLAEREQKNA